MFNKYKYIISLLTLTVIINGCNQQPAEEEHHHEEEAHGEEEIALSKEQIQQAGIHLGPFDYQPLGQYITTNGTIELPPNNLASITPIMNGFVESIRFLEGAEVKKGQALVSLKNPDYITLQQEYIQAINNFNVLEKELERQRTLAKAEVGAQKKLQQTEADFNNAKAQKSALSERLKYLGISPAKVAQGNIQNMIYLTAPFDGTVTSVNAHNGQYVKAGEPIMELINREHMHLELQLFQKDIHKVKEGQKIIFKVPAFENNKQYEGEVSLVGKNMNPQTKTIRVHGHFHEEFDLIAGLYVEANILQDTSKVRVLPEEAVIQNEGQYYFFTENEKGNGTSTFIKNAFTPGTTSHNFTEIKAFSNEADTTKIVKSGSFYLKSEMNKGEGGHHH
ncbi:efflux RND transporter periplasmic adaptor subunit [Fulvivirga sediminis]|uniref:Efflux RND transporter periplasmic adaptor subunit n=1 Tax=Fulvivirga sediminis TaxID=2803949 RepID=A0A937F5H8_9BACT|nr:efflux RND transporter periplasmic adaptor subunit [Fulvivirga sediminis]MBL3656135.1 efflux RND transporter periplasmic adaptor subunit [Fulvivirga sediminis]